MTIRTLIGRIICAVRKRMGRGPGHTWGRAYVASNAVTKIGDGYLRSFERVKRCTRCGAVVPVRTRKRAV